MAPVSSTSPDLEITAHVSAQELRFQQVGKVTVVFRGVPKRETIWKEDRHNVPTPAQSGVTYRDIRSTFHVSSRFAEIERILEQALGGNFKLGSPGANSNDFIATEEKPFPAIAAPLPPLPISTAAIPAPKPVLPPKGVLP